MRYSTTKDEHDQVAFYFPHRSTWAFEIFCYLTRSAKDPRAEGAVPVLFLNTGNGKGSRHGEPPFPDEHYVHAPPEGIRHAAATGDPTLLIDWLLENACGGRPWLEAALRAACVEAA